MKRATAAPTSKMRIRATARRVWTCALVARIYLGWQARVPSRWVLQQPCRQLGHVAAQILDAPVVADDVPGPRGLLVLRQLAALSLGEHDLVADACALAADRVVGDHG